MNFRHAVTRYFTVLPVAALGMAAPVLFAGENPVAASSTQSANAAITTLTIKAFTPEDITCALAQIDTELGHLKRLANAAPTLAMKVDLEQRHLFLQEQRSRLGKQFTESAYLAFRAELQADKDRVSAWAREPSSTELAMNSLTPATGAATIPVAERTAQNQAISTGSSNADPKGALERVELEIAQLETRLAASRDNDQKNTLKQTLVSLKEQRATLKSSVMAPPQETEILAAGAKTGWSNPTQTQ